jgi:hypothetical protein
MRIKRLLKSWWSEKLLQPYRTAISNNEDIKTRLVINHGIDTFRDTRPYMLT